MLGSAVLLAASAATRPTPAGAVAYTRPSLESLSAPCRMARDDSQDAARSLRSQSTEADANRALRKIGDGLTAVARCRDAMPALKRLVDKQYFNDQGHRKYVEDLRRVNVANDGVLWSQRGQAQMLFVLNGWNKRFSDDEWKRSLARADGILQSCGSPACKSQIAFNAETRRWGPLDTNDPCLVAERDANSAGDTLNKFHDPIHARAAAAIIADGLAKNGDCKSRPQMAAVDRAFLTTWQLKANHDLNVPLEQQRFDDARAQLTACANGEVPPGAFGRSLPDDVKKKCRDQIASNDATLALYRQQEQRTVPPAVCAAGTLPTGQGGACANAAPVTVAYSAVSPSFDWTKPVNREQRAFADERVQDPESGLWRPVSAGQNPRGSGTNDWVLFAAIRSADDARAMFDQNAASTLPPQYFQSDFYRGKMLVVAMEGRPNQQCALKPTQLQPLPTSDRNVTNLHVVYSVACGPLVPAQLATPAMLALAVDRLTGEVDFGIDRIPVTGTVLPGR